MHSDAPVPDDARWTSGASVDSRGPFSKREAEALGDPPELAPAQPRPELHSAIQQAKAGVLRKAKDALTP